MISEPINAVQSRKFRDEVNKRLRRPFSRQWYAMKIFPLMEETGHAQRGVTGFLVAANYEPWEKYLIVRERMIDLGLWAAVRDLTTEEMEDVWVSDATTWEEAVANTDVDIPEWLTEEYWADKIYDKALKGEL